MVEILSPLQEDIIKGRSVGNYTPIACLSLLWKLLSGIIVDKVYKHLDEQHLLPEEQN